MERKNSTEWNTVIRKVNRAGQMGCTLRLDMYNRHTVYWGLGL